MREWAGEALALIGAKDSAPSRPQPPPCLADSWSDHSPIHPLTTSHPHPPPPGGQQAPRSGSSAPQNRPPSIYAAVSRLNFLGTHRVQSRCACMYLCACLRVHRHVSVGGGVDRPEDCTLEVERLQIVLFDTEAQVEGQRVLAPLQCSSLS